MKSDYIVTIYSVESKGEEVGDFHKVTAGEAPKNVTLLGRQLLEKKWSSLNAVGDGLYLVCYTL